MHMKQGCLHRGVAYAEHRAFIVAMKSGKPDGAKGGREVDARRTCRRKETGGSDRNI